jgi:putative serine protease PepD
LATGSPTPIDRSPNSIPSIAARLLPSVVTLNVSGSTESGTGSGVIIRSDGYILTNNHVVAVAANGGTITADFYKGRQKVPARIVGRDPKTDLAVVRVDATNLPAATLGQSSSLVVGDPVIALGAPLGLSSTVTSGIISALDRNVEVPSDSGGAGGLIIGAIQTDAAINPGNSGGPLVDAKAQVIGINSAIAAAPGSTGSSGNIGVGFAIPIDYARSIADEIIRTGHATHPYVGVSASPADTNGGTPGAKIISVVPGGPADLAGLKPDDVIIKVDNKAIDDVDALVAATRLHKVGDVVTITYLRDGQTHTASVTLQESRN